MIDTKDICIEVVNHIGVIQLNRVKALNALSLPMIEKISYFLDQWENDSNIYMILFKSLNDKFFCSGGDVKSLYLNNQAYVENYLAKQYLMDYHIHIYKKPVISFLDGIAYGGGVGLGLAASYVVASEKARLAMPETKIGFFPDVGTTRMLNDLDHYIGRYIGLLGIELDYKDIEYLNLAKLIIKSDDWNQIENDFAKYKWTKDNIGKDIESIFKKYRYSNSDDSYIKKHVKDIESIFSKQTIIDMYNALNQDTWDLEIKQRFEEQSPSALHVTLELLNQARDKTIYECFKLEHDLSRHVVHMHDFKEGVRSLLVDKDKRFSYQPKHLNDVSIEEVKKLFDFSKFKKPHIMDKMRGI